MSTDILLVSRARNPVDDSRYQHANAPAVRVEIIESSWMFDLVVNGVEVASRMTTTDLRVLWRRLGVYLHGVGELTDEDRSARVNLAAIETTQPDDRELDYENVDTMRSEDDALRVENERLTDEIKRLRGALYTVMGVCHDECSCAASVVAKRALYDTKEKP